MESERNRLLGRWRLLTPIGMGAVGSVWRAADEQSGRIAAVKLLHESVSQDAGLIGRLRQAVVAAQQLQHPGCVELYEWGRHGNRYFIASKYVPLPHLVQYQAEHQPLSVEAACRIVTTATDALVYAHAQGIGHLNLKPRNILVPVNGTVVLTDFGLAAPLQQARPSPLLAISHLYGNPAYLAPELVRGDEPGPAADIYALGLILYELLVGRPAFVGDNDSLVQQQLLADPTPLAQIRPSLPPQLSQIVASAVAKETADRYPTMAAFSDELRRFFVDWYVGRQAQRNASRPAPPTTQLDRAHLPNSRPSLPPLPPLPSPAKPVKVVVPRPANYVKGPMLPTRALKPLKRRPVLLYSLLAALVAIMIGWMLMGMPHLG